MVKFSFPSYQQLDAMDCGPTCLRMIAKYYGRSFSIQCLREKSFITREGVSMLGISDAAESIGFRTNGVKITFEQLVTEKPLPCILHWNQNHFVVCYNIRKIKNGEYEVKISDPVGEKYTLNKSEFLKCWISSRLAGEDTGSALLLEPSPYFYTQDNGFDDSDKNLSYFLRYLKPYKSQIIQLVIGLLVGSILSLILPFLTQAVVDQGIGNSNLNFITLILIAQLVLFITQLSVEFIRNWITLHVNTRISISLISDFLAKLMRLPIRFFDTKNVGDIMQRIGDNNRIESFLTGSTLMTLFSFVNFIIFAIILAYYNLVILAIFLLGNILYIIWILLFLRYRRKLDMARFSQASAEQSNLVQIVTGMQEIKLNNSEKQQRWKWERIQVKLFKISIKGLALGQYQQIGAVFFTQTTSLFISFIAARSVTEGDMTLGMMMAVSYIIGQLSGPIGQVIGFVQAAQDAKISLERLNEIHNKEDEEQTIESKINELPSNKSIHIEDLYFSYDGADRNYVLDGINLTIPENKVTAIVGTSGSGKTTLIKLLLAFYEPNKGNIKIKDIPIDDINPHLWRQKSGAVMQDGFIFSDTIANNIAVGEDYVDKQRLIRSVEVANIKEFIELLPLKYNTKIGMEGNGISQGQRQRLLIARAVYKNPEFLFFDEATNALDANNEKIILDNLNNFYKGKTVIIVAHRLSTVQSADNIVVMDKGKIIEEGSHKELTDKKGAYYTLVKNQLELGM
ncbi:ATP-binding cassette subfamily B protein [Dysgonomonas sp. PFB1-18]|uniref:peptidase domain-containing ABC transporter n=1 Tax=unclassified Dysgonomonas TaxID=2630389 RepID=UPI00247416F8|nr:MULTISPECIES: peptidase domain-containing ABC transporter [unclassified Dysgonomonas]MDH6310610.1 ATP-binding cassette subfamily B protein [Dysgonomonas sp. PF1-14]MDH6340461.1 ATP-binding cassette subfamily B protein [Dysgonomonas sp. PF1-16]MDH6382131.1 ATP-binding cassette subfamily B protein [Dysgonomonas sp. PFB1-18]MDH6399475.1 ATP-binding cassette subfamily B protein [Dysgonomonas sp. PF1-23]